MLLWCRKIEPLINCWWEPEVVHFTLECNTLENSWEISYEPKFENLIQPSNDTLEHLSHRNKNIFIQIFAHEYQRTTDRISLHFYYNCMLICNNPKIKKKVFKKIFEPYKTYWCIPCDQKPLSDCPYFIQNCVFFEGINLNLDLFF